MRTLRTTCVVAFSLASVLMAAGPSDSNETSTTSFPIPRPFVEVNKAASDGMDVLKQLIKDDKQLAQDLGLQPAGDVADGKMSIGSGIPIVRIPARGLLNYDRNTDVLSLLDPVNQFVYPILLGEQVRSSITVAKDKDEKWKPVAFGAVPLPLVQANQQDAATPAFIVRVYKLERWFLGTLQNGQLMLSPINPKPGHADFVGKQELGKKENARDVLPSLAEDVKEAVKRDKVRKE